MRKAFRLLALLLLVATLAVWLATGANRGWTSTEDTVKTPDEVTGIEGVTQVKKFRPGIDFLGAAFFGTGLLTGLSFVFRAKPNNNQP